MAAQWFVRAHGKEQGPFASSRLKALAAEGRIDLETEVRREDSNSWVPARRIKGLFPPNKCVEKPQLRDDDVLALLKRDPAAEEEDSRRAAEADTETSRLAPDSFCQSAQRKIDPSDRVGSEAIGPPRRSQLKQSATDTSRRSGSERIRAAYAKALKLDSIPIGLVVLGVVCMLTCVLSPLGLALAWSRARNRKKVRAETKELFRQLAREEGLSGDELVDLVLAEVRLITNPGFLWALKSYVLLDLKQPFSRDRCEHCLHYVKFGPGPQTCSHCKKSVVIDELRCPCGGLHVKQGHCLRCGALLLARHYIVCSGCHAVKERTVVWSVPFTGRFHCIKCGITFKAEDRVRLEKVGDVCPPIFW